MNDIIDNSLILLKKLTLTLKEHEIDKCIQLFSRQIDYEEIEFFKSNKFIILKEDPVIVGLKEYILIPLIFPNLFLNIRQTSNMILLGIKNSSKLSLIKWIITQLIIEYPKVNKSNINPLLIIYDLKLMVDNYEPPYDRKIRDIFNIIRGIDESFPIILYLNNLDQIARENSEKYFNRSYTELLCQIDYFRSKQTDTRLSLLLASSFNPDNIDSSLFKRFDKRFVFHQPNNEQYNFVVNSLFNIVTYLPQPISVDMNREIVKSGNNLTVKELYFCFTDIERCLRSLKFWKFMKFAQLTIFQVLLMSLRGKKGFARENPTIVNKLLKWEKIHIY